MEAPLTEEDESDEADWLRAAAHNPAFADLRDPAEDIYLLADGKPLQVATDSSDAPRLEPGALLVMAAEVYAELSDHAADDVERIALDRRSFFTKR